DDEVDDLWPEVENIIATRLTAREQALHFPLAAREQALLEEIEKLRLELGEWMARFDEIGKPHAYGVEVLVNAGTASAYWQLEDDEGPRDTEEGAEDVRDMMLAEGYRLDHLRIVALTVVRGAR